MSERVLVCGGREWQWPGVIYGVLDRIHRAEGVEVVIHGDCRGADRHGEQWAKNNEVAYIGEPARWKTGGRGRAEGVIRNASMLKRWSPTVVIGFHSAIHTSRGTWDMLERADAAGLPTRCFDRYGNEVDWSATTEPEEAE